MQTQFTKNLKRSRSIPKDYEGLRGIIAKMVSKLWDLTQMQTQFIKNPEGSLKIPNVYEGLSTTVSINCKNWIKMQIQIKKNPKASRRIPKDYEGSRGIVMQTQITKNPQSIPKHPKGSWPTVSTNCKIGSRCNPKSKRISNHPEGSPGIEVQTQITKNPKRTQQIPKDCEGPPPTGSTNCITGSSYKPKSKRIPNHPEGSCSLWTVIVVKVEIHLNIESDFIS